MSVCLFYCVSVLLSICLNVKVSAIKRIYRSKFCLTAFYNLCAAQVYFNFLDDTATEIGNIRLLTTYTRIYIYMNTVFTHPIAYINYINIII